MFAIICDNRQKDMISVSGAHSWSVLGYEETEAIRVDATGDVMKDLCVPVRQRQGRSVNPICSPAAETVRLVKRGLAHLLRSLQRMSPQGAEGRESGGISVIQYPNESKVR